MLKKTGARLALALSVLLGSSVFTVPVYAMQTVNVVVMGGAATKVTTEQSQAVTNWGNTENSYIEAVGLGLMQSGTPKALARRAAVVDAYRNLAEAVEGVQVDSDTTVEKLSVVNDTVKTHVSALIKGAKIVEEGVNTDGSYYVKMRMPLYGSVGLASVVIPNIAPAKQEVFPSAPEYAGPIAAQAYTGLVIDARGLNVISSLAPSIFDESGRCVYGMKYVDPDFAVNKGIVEYARNDDMVNNALAGKTRAGQNPLVIKAVAAKTSVTGVNKVGAVISVADADRVLAENARSNFLEKYAVVFEI